MGCFFKREFLIRSMIEVKKRKKRKKKKERKGHQSWKNLQMLSMQILAISEYDEGLD